MDRKLSELSNSSQQKLGPILTTKLGDISSFDVDAIPIVIQFVDKATAQQKYSRLKSASERSTKEALAVDSQQLEEKSKLRSRSIFKTSSLVGKPHPNENHIRNLNLVDIYDVFGMQDLRIQDNATIGTTEVRNLKLVGGISTWLPHYKILDLLNPSHPTFDDIKILEYDFNVQSFMELTESHLGVPSLWSRDPNLTGEGIVIGILDTGIAATKSADGKITASHPDFDGRILDIKDFTGSDPDLTLTDATSHCTHIVGSICGSGKASNGRYKGIAPDAKVCIGKVLSGKADNLQSIVIDGIQWAIDSHVDIISLSLGSFQYNTGKDLLCQAVNAAVDSGIVVCAAAGNFGPYTIGTPGSAEKVLTVGSVNLVDELSEWSSTAPVPSSYTYTKPDILAPGEEIISALAPGFKYQYKSAHRDRPPSKPSLPADLQDYYTFLSGTSMSTPIVAGIVTLMLDAHNKAYGSQKQKSIELVDKIKSALTSTAKDIGHPPDQEGHGVILPSKALAALLLQKDLL